MVGATVVVGAIVVVSGGQVVVGATVVVGAIVVVSGGQVVVGMVLGSVGGGVFVG